MRSNFNKSDKGLLIILQLWLATCLQIQNSKIISSNFSLPAKSRMITNNRLQISKLQVSHPKMTTETENKKRKDVAGTQLSIVKGL